MTTVANFLQQFPATPRPHEWVVRFELSSVLKSALVAKGVDMEVVDNIDLLAEEHRLPGVTLEIIALSLKGSPYSYPQRSNRSGSLDIPFKEILDKNLKYGVWKFLTEWANLADSAEEGVGLPLNVLKGDMLVDFYSNLNNEATQTKLFTIRYRFVYPTAVPDITTLGEQATAIVKPTGTFLYDLWKYD